MEKNVSLSGVVTNDTEASPKLAQTPGFYIQPGSD